MSMKIKSKLPSWIDVSWEKRVQSWIDKQLEKNRIIALDEIEEVQIRPWSIVLRIKTEPEVIYFKAPAPTLVHEGVLSNRLNQWFPEHTPELLACNEKNGWMLLKDMGVTLRSLYKPEKKIELWYPVLETYAGLQIGCLRRTQELEQSGVFNRRLSELSDKFEALLGNKSALLIGKPDGLTTQTHQQLLELLPRYLAYCRELQDFPISETLQHDDFHGANIFVREGHFRLADWGETCLAFPFFSMLVTLRSIAYHSDLDLKSTQISDLSQVYLNCWKTFASEKDLRHTLEISNKVAMVSRALTWYEILEPMTEDEKAPYADSVPGWLMEFLDSEIA